MELEILDTIIIESYGDWDEHNKLVDKTIKETKPKYYAIETDLTRLLWSTTIFVME